MSNETAVAVVNAEDFRALAIVGNEPGALMELLEENIGGQISVFDLPKLTVPSGGGDHWSVPTAEGTRMEKEIEGVILLRKAGKAYWEVSLDDSTETTPPNCVSEDGLMGTGTPGGPCRVCPLNAFESASKGKGKACKDKVDLFLLTKTGIMPMIIQVPPTSLKNLKQYGMILMDGGKAIGDVLTKFYLTPENKSGKKTAIINFKSSGNVPDGLKGFVNEYKKTLKAMLEQGIAQNQTVEDRFVAQDGEAPSFE